MTKASGARAARRTADAAGVNRVRGEKMLKVGANSYKLRLNMAALAEIEDAFELDSIDQLEDALKAAPTTRSIAKVLGPMIRAGGLPDFKDDEVRRFDIEFDELVESMFAALNANRAPGDAKPGE